MTFNNIKKVIQLMKSCKGAVGYLDNIRKLTYKGFKKAIFTVDNPVMESEICQRQGLAKGTTQEQSIWRDNFCTRYWGTQSLLENVCILQCSLATFKEIAILKEN